MAMPTNTEFEAEVERAMRCRRGALRWYQRLLGRLANPVTEMRLRRVEDDMRLLRGHVWQLRQESECEKIRDKHAHAKIAKEK